MFIMDLLSSNIQIMKKSPDNSSLNRVKKWLFEYITIVDFTRPTNTYLLLLMSLLELGVLPFFYYHPHYSFQKNFPLIVQYITLKENYFIHMTPFSNNILTLITLSIYPFVIVLVLVIKWLGQMRILVIVVQLAIFLMPFLLIKIVLQTVVCMQCGGVMLAGLLLSLVSLAFATIVFLLIGKIHRYLQIPIIMSLSFGGNEYVIIAMLGLRLSILAYLQYRARISSILSICFQTALYLQLLSLLFCSSELLNYISFSFLIACCFIFGLYRVNLELNRGKNIYDYLDAMEEEEGCEFEVLRIVEQHETACTFVTCKCHSYLQWDLKQLKEWVYRYEQERLKKKNSFRQRLQYAQVCTERYNFKLNGLIRVSEAHPNSLEEEYQILKICQIYENNLRKQDKNYKHGEVYLHINQEQQLLSQNLSKIINMIKEFWKLIANFDGSTKFLTLILNISHAIAHLQASYQHLLIKYDQDLVNLKYLMDLFRTIVLNEKINEEDQITVPQPVTFLISSGNKILKVNNNFALLVNRPLDQLIGSSYLPFIPECYREPHNKWIQQFVQKIGQYEDKKLEKSFAVDDFEIQQVLMEHRVLPRFMQGLEIFTTIQSSIQSDSFITIVEKDTLLIKNIEASFYQLTKFRYNQRNIKQLQQMLLPAIFQNINLTPSATLQQTILTTFFIEEHTHIKKIIKNQKRSGRRSLGIGGSGGHSRNGAGTIKMKIDEDDALFYYEVLPNSHDDTYIKIRFTPKNKRPIKIADDDQSNSRLDKASQLQQSITSRQQKSQDFHLPVYMLLLFVVVHIVAISMFAVFKEGLTVVDNRYKFYVAYDQTILYSKNITVGSNQVHNLQSLWIKGYGDYSESINAFLWVSDPHFGVYVNSTVSVDFHNSLFIQIEDNSQDILKKVQLFKLLLVVIFSAATAFYLLDFILSLRYIFKIERKVGDLLLQFIRVNQDDIQLLDDTLDNFLVNILNQMQKKSKPQKIPLETAQQSAMELLRGSPKNSGLNYQDGDSIVERKSTYRRHSSSFFGDSEKMSLSQIKLDFIEYSQPDRSKRRNSKLSSSNFDQQAIRQENILHFQQQYGSCQFVLRTNSRLFLLIVIGLLLACSLIIGTFFLLYIPASDYSARLKILQSLYESKIILYKSLTEITLNNFSLYPLEIFSEQLLEIEKYLSQIQSNEHDQFRKQLNTSLRGDVCSVFNYSSVCGSTSTVNIFGLTIMAQQIQEYFRLRDDQAITVENTQNTLIDYSQSLLDSLISSYTLANTNMDNNLLSLEILFVVFGTVAVALSLLLNWWSLREFRNRIEDSKSLLKIIPRQIRSRHEFEGQKLDQKEFE